MAVVKESGHTEATNDRAALTTMQRICTMADRADITPELCRQLLRYDPDTGRLFWKDRSSDLFAESKNRWGGVHSAEARAKTWNTRYAGTEAFTASSIDDYLRGALLGKSYLAHRVVWAIVYGAWPESEVDHVNMDRADNRMANLRAADHSENNRNRSVQSNNTSGLKCVSWHKGAGKWRAQIVLHGKPRHIGLFATSDEAYAAYRAAVGDMHGEYARTA